MKDLDLLVDAAATDLAEAARREHAPDFAAVVAEAHARDPKRVPAAALAEVRSLAPVVELHSDAHARAPRREQAEFAALLAAARAELDADVAAVRAAGPPPVPVPAARSAANRPWVWLAAAAAIVALGLGLRPLLTRGEANDGTANQAPWQEQASPSQHEVAPAPTKAHPVARPEPVEVPAPVVAPAPAPVDVRPDMPSSAGPKEQLQIKPPAKPRGESLVERLRRLDGEAEAKWEAGDLAGAEALYRQIVTQAPGGRAADLAYGDLFSLVRQRHTGDEEVALWREYLQTFPRGRYADDARAGLCRRADEGERVACWRAYAADFPHGVHRHQAARALEGPP